MRKTLLLLLLLTIAAPAFAQSVDRDLPRGRAVELALWNADVRVVLSPGATPHLLARAVIVDDALGEAVPAEGPTVALGEKGAVLAVARAAESEAVRLRIEVTLDVSRRVKVAGRDLDVVVEAPALDFGRMAARRSEAAERGEEPPAPAWTDVWLRLEGSRADLSGVAGAALEGRDTWFVVRQSANRLDVTLDGGAAELTRHRGALRLEGRGGEVELSDAMGEISFQLEGTRLAISDAEGTLDGQARRGATVELYDWGGNVEIESSDSVLDLRGFRPGAPTVTVRAEGSELTVEAMGSGQLDADLKGGRMRLRDVNGKMKLTTSRDADVEMERLKGSWKGVFQDSTVVALEVERLDVELADSSFRVDGAEDLRLVADASEVDATRVRNVGHALLTDTRADLDLAEGARAQIEARGESRVFIGMQVPCFVLTPSPRRGEDGAKADVAETAVEIDLDLDVTGCTLGPDVGREDQDDERASPSFLTLTQDDEAELDVRGI